MCGSAVLVLAFVGLRVYGAYQRERDDALERAEAADQMAKEFGQEYRNLKLQSDCNLLWTKYESAVLEKRIAELRGSLARAPVEPVCTGHAERMDEVLNLASRQLQLLSNESGASNFAHCERVYARSRKYQTHFLLIRVWAFLTGTNPKTNPAKMVAKDEATAELEGCIKRAKNDSDLRTCNDQFASVQEE